MISFIVPAHNEELWIAKCLNSIRAAMEKVAQPYEVIVVDDASTDSTGRIAEQMGARLLRVECRRISAVRNTGAGVARGEFFFFVDADTQVNERAVGAGLAILRSGAAGGGCVFDFDGPTPLWGRVILFFSVIMARIIRWVGGCFIFCTREAFQATGGFCETLYAGEDIAFVQALKKVGRFAIPKAKVLSSGRKLKVVTLWEVIRLIGRIAARGKHYESKMIVDLLYGRRAQDARKASKADLPAQKGPQNGGVKS